MPDDDPADVPFPENEFYAPETWFLSRVTPDKYAGGFDKIVFINATDGVQFVPLFTDKNLAERYITDSESPEDDSADPIYTYSSKSRGELVALLQWLVTTGVTRAAYDPGPVHAKSHSIAKLLAGLRRG